MTVSFAAPLALPTRASLRPFHLDGLIVSLLAAREGSLRTLAADFDPAEDPFAPGRCPAVPLAVAERNGVRVYQASAALVPDSAFPLKVIPEWIVKRGPGETRRGEPLNPARRNGGGDDAWNYPCMERRFLVWIPRVEFWCVGDPEGLGELLSRVKAIGPGRNQGFGRVACIDLHRAPSADPATWGVFDGRGRPVRILPLAFWPEGEALGWRKAAAAWRPPYWHPANRDLCWVPAKPTAPDVAAFWLAGVA